MSTEQNVAVLWDVENVTPSVDSLFLDGFFEYISNFGTISLAQAFGNWTNPAISQLAKPLVSKYFELYHIPKSRKNSADISMIAKGIEIIHQYPKINIFILVTGDVDFRPLVLALRKQSKIIHIVCDVKNASEDLLSLAHSFKDYRSLIPSDFEEENIEEEEKSASEKEERVNADQRQGKLKNAFKLLVDAIKRMKSEQIKPGIGYVKIRMQMLNSSFDEKTLGFNSFSSFISAAVENGYVFLEREGLNPILNVTKTSSELQLSEFSDLLKVLKELGVNDFHNYSEVNNLLKKKYKFNFKSVGYKKFSDYIRAAETRDLVEIHVSGLTHSVRAKKV